MKEELKILGGEPIRRAPNAEGTGVSENGGGNSQPNSVNGYTVNNQGKGTEVQSETNINTYGQDIANFANFKKDSNDAMSITNSTATRVKMALLEFKHNYPDVQLSLEPMPNPANYGKKREGFILYQQALRDWEILTNESIRLAKEDAKKNYATGSSVSTGPVESISSVPKEEVKEQKEQGSITPEEPAEDDGVKLNRTNIGGSKKAGGRTRGERSGDAGKTQIGDNGTGKTKSKNLGINPHFRAKQVIDASEGIGTNNPRFIAAVTQGKLDKDGNSESNLYTNLAKRKPLTKEQAIALDKEIRNQTAGKQDLLKLMDEEFTLYRSTNLKDKFMTMLYNQYKEYLKEENK